MSKKILILPVVAVIVIIAAALAVKNSWHDSDAEPSDLVDKNPVSITMSSSRPGCESTDRCFVPSKIAIKAGEAVTWTNNDSGFHTVTGGYYDTPDGTFDSEQMDPNQKFMNVFNSAGSFHYFCKLHPWMQGEVKVS